MDNTILQWNCRGLRANIEEVQRLSREIKPSLICLQETLLNEKNPINLRYYSTYHKFGHFDSRSTGGVAVMAQNKIPHQHIFLNTTLQAVAVTVTLHRVLTICNIYIPPTSPIRDHDLDSLVTQLPSPFIIVGDLNGHNPIWGSPDINERGRKISDFLDRHQLCLYNNKSPTYLHPATGTLTHLDLSICHPSLLLDYSWRVFDDLCGSDHFPVVLENLGAPISDHIPRWKLHKANWDKFQSLSLQTLTTDKVKNCTDSLLYFTSQVLEIAEECIPKSSANHSKKTFFDEECNNAIKARKTALRRFKNNPTNANLNAYRQLRARARRTIKLSKKKSWKEYVSKISTSTPTKKVWDMVRRISGKSIPSAQGHLKINDTVFSTKKEIADQLSSTFSKNSSSTNCTQTFQNHKQTKEKIKLNFSSKNEEIYNKPFSLDELQDSLQKSHDTAPGPDQIHYQFLKHLSEPSLKALLYIINDIFQSGDFPKSWKEATIVPIPKPNKNNTDPSSYRPHSSNKLHL